jgi:hypothetical protein
VGETVASEIAFKESTAAAATTTEDSILQWTLTSTSKYDTEEPRVVSKLSPTSLHLAEIFQDFELGLADEQHLALNIITALFERDFTTPGEHWDIDSATATVMENFRFANDRFAVEKQATWDRKGICSVASAKGTVCFLKDSHEIRVEEYSYYVAG